MIQLIILERWTLLKGYILSTLIIFPFTFLPILFSDGPLIGRVIERAPMSLIYTAGFSLLVVMAAVYQNYERQNLKMEYFGMPSIKSLNFESATEGFKSLVHDFNVFLIGKFSDRYWKLDIIVDLEEPGKNQLMINPVINDDSFQDNRSFIKSKKLSMSRDFQLTSNPDKIEILINLNEINFEDRDAIRKTMNIIEYMLKKTVPNNDEQA